MAPVFPRYKHIKRRICRSISYGNMPNKTIPFPISQLIVKYFENRNTYLDPATSASISSSGYTDVTTILVSLMYLDRLQKKQPEFFRTAEALDLYVPALLLAGKYLHDPDQNDFVYTSEWAEICEISQQRAEAAEWEFVKQLDWDLKIDQDRLDSYFNDLEVYIASERLHKNESISYQELVQLSSTIPSSVYKLIFAHIVSAFALALFSYSLFVASMAAVPTGIELIAATTDHNQSSKPAVDFPIEYEFPNPTVPLPIRKSPVAYPKTIDFGLEPILSFVTHLDENLPAGVINNSLCLL